MKKTTTLLMFLSVMVISLTQSCNKTVTTETKTPPVDSIKIYEAKDTVAIYLTSVRRNDGNGNYSYHLAMFDANGDYAIDTLITVFKMDNAIKPSSGNIQWIKVTRSGIKKIIEIKPVNDTTVIFRNGTSEKHGVWNLDLPDTINIPEGMHYIKEKYLIKYIPKGSNDTITIDPYLRVPPD
jgi:hypothetical protein